MIPAIEYKAIFFNKMADVFFLRTKPASSMAKPSAMNMTRIPPNMKRNVLKTNAVSAETSALAIPDKNKVGIRNDNIFFIMSPYLIASAPRSPVRIRTTSDTSVT